MATVRNTVLAGNGLSDLDKTKSITTWPSVKANDGNTYVFCEWIQTTEINNPIYARDKAYRANVSGAGFDYYPCRLQGSSSIFGVYNKVDNIFTQKTLLTSSSHGVDKPYGISTGDVKAACGSGYHNLILIMCEDAGPQAWVDDEHPSDGCYVIADLKFSGNTFVSLKLIDSAFYLAPSVRLPDDKIDTDGYTHKYYHLPEYQTEELAFLLGAPYNLPMWGGPSGIVPVQINPDNSYVNGDLIKGRKPRWNLWADNVNLGKWLSNGGVKLYSTDGGYANQKIVSTNIFKYLGRSDDSHVQLFKWQNYDNSKYTAPYAKIDSDNKIKIELHNGASVALSVASYLNSFAGFNGLYDITKTDNRMVWIWNKSMLSEIFLRLGNIIDWNATTQNYTTYGLKVILNAEPYLGYNGGQALMASKIFYGVNSSTPLNSSTLAAVKKLFKDGLNEDDSLHNWDIDVDAEVIFAWYNYWQSRPANERFLHDFFLTVTPLCQGVPEVKVGGMWNVGIDFMAANVDYNQFPLYPGYQGLSWTRGDYALSLNDYASKTMCGIDTTKFRFVIKTPKLTIGGVEYNVIPAMHYAGVSSDEWRNQPSSFDSIGGSFFIRNYGNGTSVTQSYGGGVGWRFVLEKVNKTGATTDYLKNRVHTRTADNTMSGWDKINRLQCTYDIYTNVNGTTLHCQIVSEAAITNYSSFPSEDDEYAGTRFANLFSQSSFNDILKYSVQYADGGNWLGYYPEDSIYRTAAFHNETGDVNATNVIPIAQLVTVKEEVDGSGRDVYMLNPNSTVVLSITPI